MTKATFIIVTLALAFMLLFITVGCGHKGPLIAPDPSAEKPINTSSQDNSAAQSTFELPNNS